MPTKKGTQQEDLLETLGEGEEAEGGNGTSAAEVAVKGRGRTVSDALKKAGLKDAAKDLKGRFNELIRDPKNKIVCQRILPRQIRGQDGKMRDCADVVDLPPPMTLDEITNNLREEYGGKKWNVRVIDEDGEVKDARNVDVPGEPKVVAKPEDDFEIPSLEEFGGDGPKEEKEDPLDRDIANKEKESKLLMLDRQNAQLRSQVAEAKGELKKAPEVDVQKIVADALAAQETRHRAELAERDKRFELAEMERRINDGVKVQIGEMKGLIEKLQAGNPSQATALSDLSHKLDLVQQGIDTKVKDALGSYREMTNQQISALEKGFDAKLTSIQATLAAIQSHKPDNPIKDMVPLITSSIERSTQGYKEFIGPLLSFVAKKPEEVEGPDNPLEATLETLNKFNMLPGTGKSGDFGSRVVDFAEKLAPEVMQFVREEKRAGREVNEAALKNHLKLQAERIAEKVSASAAQEIRQIAAQRGITPSGQLRGLPAPGQTVTPQGATGQSPVGKMSPEEAARYQQRHQSAPTPAAAPAPAAIPAPAAPLPQASAPPAPAPPPTPPVQRVEPTPQPEPEEEEVGEEEGEEEGEPMTIEEEMAARVNDVLELLEREMRIRPRQITWPNAAWDDLPGEVLNQIIFANDEEDVYRAIEPYADKELSERIWSHVRADAKCKEFIVAGINIVKGWAVELQEKQRQAAQGGAPAAPEGGESQA